MASSDFGQRLSVDTDKFWISRKDGIGRKGLGLLGGEIRMAAAGLAVDRP